MPNFSLFDAPHHILFVVFSCFYMFQAKMNFVSVRSSDLLSKYFGQTESAIRLLFKQVRAAAPCVLFLDEFDVLAFKR